MAILGGFQRNWRQFNPPVVSKQDDALKFGILGAAKIVSVIPYIIHMCKLTQARQSYGSHPPSQEPFPGHHPRHCGT
jgi:hypothetical protein